MMRLCSTRIIQRINLLVRERIHRQFGTAHNILKLTNGEKVMNYMLSKFNVFLVILLVAGYAHQNSIAKKRMSDSLHMLRLKKENS